MSIKNGKFFFTGLIKPWIKKLKIRNELRSLNNRDLRDIGITEDDVVQPVAAQSVVGFKSF